MKSRSPREKPFRFSGRLTGAGQMVNWQGLPFYVAKRLVGSRAWRDLLHLITTSEADELHRASLRRLLDHATQHVPHYTRLGLRNRPLSEYPILTKQQLRKNPEAFARDDLSEHRHNRVASSGSTGETIEVLLDADAGAWREAVDLWYLSELLKTPPSTYIRRSKIYIWHRHQQDHLSWSNRLGRLTAPIRWLEPYKAFTEEGLLDYASRVNRLRPAYIWSYTGVLYEMARAAQRRGIRLHRPHFIIASGETLYPYMRSVIEEVFGCRVYDYYGSTETGRVAAECAAGNLHIFTFSVHVEILAPSGNPVSSGEQGRLILTPLHNLSMPLIRYDSQDVAEAGPEECPCGCPLPTLRRLMGRTVEFFVTRNGSLVSGGRIGRLMRHCPWVLGFQILQKDIDRITIFFTPIPTASPSPDDIERVNQEIAAVFGPECQVTWHEVGEIPQTPNGKRPYARSLVWEARQPMPLWNANAP